MQDIIAYLEDFNLVSVVIRLLLAVAAGVVIGYGRSKHGRDAGLRTFVLISIGACSAMIISLYEYEMLSTVWADTVETVGMKYDASRFGSQVVAGIGFLGAGIIIKASHQQVRGLTTATGMFATVCMGIACGAGFFSVVITAILLIELVLNLMAPLESEFKRRLRNITLSVDFTSLEDIDRITEAIGSLDAQIFDIEIERAEASRGKNPSAIFILKLSRENHSHSGMLSTIAELPCVYSVKELIA